LWKKTSELEREGNELSNTYLLLFKRTFRRQKKNSTRRNVSGRTSSRTFTQRRKEINSQPENVAQICETHVFESAHYERKHVSTKKNCTW